MDFFSRLSKHLESFLWLAAFVVVTFLVYEQAKAKLMKSICSLEEKSAFLQAKIKEEEEVQEELKLQVASQSDPSWVELSLIKALGLVPEGYTKIYYEIPSEKEKTCSAPLCTAPKEHQ